jgi:hypothetical protein
MKLMKAAACSLIIPCNAVFRNGKLMDASVLLIQRMGTSKWELPNSYMNLMDWFLQGDNVGLVLASVVANEFGLSVTPLYQITAEAYFLCEDLEDEPIEFTVFLTQNETVRLSSLPMPKDVKAICLLSREEIGSFIAAGIVFPAHVGPLQTFLSSLEKGMEMEEKKETTVRQLMVGP